MVTSTIDASDNSPGDGVCSTLMGAGICTLRAAIQEANTFPGPDVIGFGVVGTFTLSVGGMNDDAALSGDLDINDDLTIMGEGVQQTIIDGGGDTLNDRVFHINPLSGNVSVSIRDLTIQNGHASNDGGGILNEPQSDLELTYVTIRANRAERGGGIMNRGNFNSSATASLNHVVVADNHATIGTGGIFNNSIMNLNVVTIRDNLTDGFIGGVFNGGVMTMTASTISGNIARGMSGGPFTGGLESGGQATLINVTISGNTGDPGGISNGGHATLVNVTITDNTGGIRNCDSCNASMTLANSIVANNTRFISSNCLGKVISQSHNLDSDGSCSFTSSGDVTGVNPGLDRLGHSVGRTPTHALQLGSPAIDGGGTANCPATDQRGVARPQGAACDIGAFELQQTSIIVTSRDDAIDINPGDGTCEAVIPSFGECTLRAAIQEANALPGPDLITFDVNGHFQLAIPGTSEDIAATGDLDITDDLTIIGNGQLQTIIDGGGPSLIDRVWHIDPAHRGVTVSISGMTVQHGQAAGGGSGIHNDGEAAEGGSGILSDGRGAILVVTDVAIQANSTRGNPLGSFGGGIVNFANMIATNISVLDNEAVDSGVNFGGGIWNSGDITIEGSLIVDNLSERGGGIVNEYPGFMQISSTTISTNIALASGAGIFNHGNLSLTNVTISGNNAQGPSGGGIFNTSVDASANLTNVTLSENEAGVWGGGIHSSGGATTSLVNSIVANSPFGGDCFGQMTSRGFNLDSDATCGFTVAGDLAGMNPLLDPLAPSGSRIQTHKLLAGSPAIDAGDPNTCPAIDQRGQSRPQDGNGDGIARCDMGAYERANPSLAFQYTWDRTDLPVHAGMVNRTWMWGPVLAGSVRQEPYVESTSGMRAVQYFDKSRMEINDLDGDPNSIWYVTNGLLVVEMVDGKIQLGDVQFDQTPQPAQINVAGDTSDRTGPTYATISGLRDDAPLLAGELITWRVDRDGNVAHDPALARYRVTAMYLVDVPGITHQVASPFWAFMNATDTVYEDGRYTTAALFQNPFYATGYPLAEAYWAHVTVAGTPRDVLIQCFERRCLTYTPDNPDGWKVEAGNVGLHYYLWRYGALP